MSFRSRRTSRVGFLFGGIAEPAYLPAATGDSMLATARRVATWVATPHEKDAPKGANPACLCDAGGGTRTPDTRIMIPLL